jgi:hypothetical protein
MEKTAVEWLEQQLFNKRGKFNKSDIEQAKEMEENQKKQLVIGTYIDLKIKSPTKRYGMEYLGEREELERDAEQYYYKTFKNK